MAGRSPFLRAFVAVLLIGMLMGSAIARAFDPHAVSHALEHQDGAALGDGVAPHEHQPSTQAGGDGDGAPIGDVEHAFLHAAPSSLLGLCGASLVHPVTAVDMPSATPDPDAIPESVAIEPLLRPPRIA